MSGNVKKVSSIVEGFSGKAYRCGKVFGCFLIVLMVILISGCNASNNKEETTAVESTDFQTQTPTQEETLLPIVSSDAKKVYLTFDDGPSEKTDKVLDILEKYGVKATFFVVSKQSPKNEERLKRIVNQGHTLAIHSFSHDYNVIYSNIEAFANDIITMQNYLQKVTGVKVNLYRFPGGSSTSYLNKTLSVRQCIDWLKANGFEYFDWNVSSGDANNVMPSKETLLKNIFEGTFSVVGRDEPVVLMHDSMTKESTVEALPSIIEKIYELGYQMAPITSDTKPVHHRD